MAKCVCSGAKIKCSFGASSKPILILPLNKTTTQIAKSLANNLDIIPLVNIPAFGNCNSPANPMCWKMAGPVPVFTPFPCTPVPIKPWDPASEKVKIGNNPAMLETSKTMCAWAGTIEVEDPGTQKIDFK